MPIASIKLRPGLRSDLTANLNEGGWSDGNMVRWREGLPEKMGGWTKLWPFQLGTEVQALHAWLDLNGVSHLAIGAAAGLNVIGSGTLTDITPQTLTSDFTPDFTTTSGTPTVEIDDPNIADVTAYDSVYFSTPIAIGGLVLSGLYPITLVTGTTTYQITAAANAASSVSSGGAVPSFTTTSGSAIVAVTLAAHGLSVGGQITFPVATAAGGVTISGTYTVNAVASANEVSITASSLASSSTTVAMNGNNARIVYYINLGLSAGGVGYGLGTYGTGGYGIGVVPVQQSGTAITATGWTLDNWGKTIIGCPENGGIYAWDPDGGFVNAALVSTSGAPLFNAGVFVAQPAQILVAYGSTTQTASNRIGVYQDPMLVRWSDQDDYTNWTVDTVDQAGSVRLPRGSRIVSGMQGPSQALLWTDLGVWAMQYVGPPLVFGFNELATGCGLVARRARTALRGVVYWMSDRNFYSLSGSGVQVVPCPVWDRVFQDIDTTYKEKCWAWSNSLFNEVWFFYPSVMDGTGACSRFVVYNALEQVWSYGILARSIGIDQSVLGAPVAATADGLIYQHESGVDADGQPIDAWIESGDFMISDGTFCAFADQLRPDAKFGKVGDDANATLKFSLTATNDISGAVIPVGPLSFTQATKYLTFRARGHRMRVRVGSDDVGTWWRLGNLRYRGAPDGRQ